MPKRKKEVEKIPIVDIPQVEEVYESTGVFSDETKKVKDNQIVYNGQPITINLKELVKFFKSLACGRTRYGNSPYGATVHLGLILGMNKDEAKAFLANFKG
jgi:hypothetical protein